MKSKLRLSCQPLRKYESTPSTLFIHSWKLIVRLPFNETKKFSSPWPWLKSQSWVPPPWESDLMQYIRAEETLASMIPWWKGQAIICPSPSCSYAHMLLSFKKYNEKWNTYCVHKRTDGRYALLTILRQRGHLKLLPKVVHFFPSLWLRSQIPVRPSEPALTRHTRAGRNSSKWYFCQGDQSQLAHRWPPYTPQDAAPAPHRWYKQGLQRRSPGRRGPEVPSGAL